MEALTYEELLAKVKALEAAQAKPAGPRGLTFKVGEKGGIGIYGLNARFPMSGYCNQWLKLLAVSDNLRQFMRDNFAGLSFKTPEDRAVAAKELGIEVV
jgi:hypothetical protein